MNIDSSNPISNSSYSELPAKKDTSTQKDTSEPGTPSDVNQKNGSSQNATPRTPQEHPRSELFTHERFYQAVHQLHSGKNVQHQKAKSESRSVIENKKIDASISSAIGKSTISCIDLFARSIHTFGYGAVQNLAEGTHIGLSFAKGLFVLPQIASKTAKGIISSVQLGSVQAKILSLEKQLEKPSEATDAISSKQTEAIPRPIQREQIRAELRLLREKKGKLQSDLFGCKEIPLHFLELTVSCIQLAQFLGEHLGTIASATLSGLSTATTILGTTAGSLAIIFGGIDISFGAVGVYKAVKEKRRLEALLKKMGEEFQKPTETPTKDQDKAVKALYALKIIELEKEIKIANNKLAKNLIVIGAGTLVVAGGALAIASIFTGGTTALVLIGIAAGIGMVATGIKIGSFIKNKLDERSIQNQIRQYEPHKLENMLEEIIKSTANDPTKSTQIQGLLKDFAKETGNTYLTGEVISDIMKKPQLLLHQLFPNIVQMTKL